MNIDKERKDFAERQSEIALIEEVLNQYGLEIAQDPNLKYDTQHMYSMLDNLNKVAQDCEIVDSTNILEVVLERPEAMYAFAVLGVYATLEIER